jgi:hypothetical protein
MTSHAYHPQKKAPATHSPAQVLLISTAQGVIYKIGDISESAAF